MKKLVFSALILGLVFTTSCNKDDDGGGKNNCKTCEMNLLGTPLVSKYCDNGDGTVSVTSEGETQKTSLDGMTFSQFIAGMQQAGFTCK